MDNNSTQLPPQYPDKYAVSDASRYLIRKISGWMNGFERREIARKSADASLREAAAILDANDARIVAERARANGGSNGR